MSKNLRLIDVGFGNIIPTDEIIAIVSTTSAPVKRLIQKAKEDIGQKNELGQEIGLFNLTNGRKARSVLMTDYGKVYLSSLQPETILAKSYDALSKNLLKKDN